MLEDFRPELVMVVGTAGGVEERGVQLGDVVVPDYLHYGDFRKLSGRGDHRRYYAYDQPSVSIRETHVDPARNDGRWRDRIQGTAPAPTTPDVRIGSLVAGEKVMGDPTHEEQRRVLREFPDALAIDMESVGAARAIHEGRRSIDYNPRFLVVRGISDLVRGAVPSAAARQRAGAQSAGGVLGDMTRVTVGAARAVVAATGLVPSPYSPATVLENSAERELWGEYAASVAAAFASELVDRMVGAPASEAAGSR
jgi:nucleoside phosphorylase